jgi:hypothetical protein
MFSFRRRPRTADTEPKLKTSPSLPEMHSQGIPWPENLVDVSLIRGSPLAEPERSPRQGAVKSSLPSSDHSPIPFHKPFRLISGQPAENGTKISSLYMSHPPSAFGNNNWRSSTAAVSTTRRAHRKNRTPPAFNLMVRDHTDSSDRLNNDPSIRLQEEEGQEKLLYCVCSLKLPICHQLRLKTSE